MSDSVSHKLLDGRKIAATILDGVARDAAALTELGWAPRLVSVTVGDEVIYGKYTASEVEVDGREVKILRESDILAKVVK